MLKWKWPFCGISEGLRRVLSARPFKQAFQFIVFCCCTTSRLIQLPRSRDNLGREINEGYDISCKSCCCKWIHDETFVPDSVSVEGFCRLDKELRSRNGERGNVLSIVAP